MRIALPTLVILAVFCAPAWAFEPTTSYDRRQIDGWTVYVSGELLKQEPKLTERVLALLRNKLFEMARVLPAAALEKVRDIPIWVELDEKEWPGMCYHPSAGWLKDHGYNPDKAGGVEIGNSRNFLTWSLDQPAMVLHEMAHAYHDKVLGYGNAEVKEAYRAAKASGTYDQVLHINGQKRKAYAMNNEQEYFAETSEAFFGTNDFYPFVRAELKTHDPKMYDLLAKLWGVPPKEKPATRPAAERTR